MANAESLPIEEFVEAVTRGTLRALDARAGAAEGKSRFIDPTWLGIWLNEPNLQAFPQLQGIKGPIWVGLVANLPRDLFRGGGPQ